MGSSGAPKGKGLGPYCYIVSKDDGYPEHWKDLVVEYFFIYFSEDNGSAGMSLGFHSFVSVKLSSDRVLENDGNVGRGQIIGLWGSYVFGPESLVESLETLLVSLESLQTFFFVLLCTWCCSCDI